MGTNESSVTSEGQKLETIENWNAHKIGKFLQSISGAPDPKFVGAEMRETPLVLALSGLYPNVSARFKFGPGFKGRLKPV